MVYVGGKLNAKSVSRVCGVVGGEELFPSVQNPRAEIRQHRWRYLFEERPGRYFFDERVLLDRFFVDPFLVERFFVDRFFEARFEPFLEPFFDPFFAGTLPPSSRASARPIAIACFLLVTFLPERPLFSVPRFRSRMACSTFSPAFFPYLGIVFRTSWTSIFYNPYATRAVDPRYDP